MRWAISIILACGLLAFLNVVINSSSGMLRTLSSHLSTYELAKKESFGFVDDVPDHAWEMIKARTHQYAQYTHPDKPWVSYEKPVMWHLENIEPTFSCLHRQRIGNRGSVKGHGDGPKWTCNPHRLAAMDDCLIYSVGCNGDYSFEEGIIDVAGAGKCEIHVFDPGNYSTPDDAELHNIHYHAWGLRSSNEKDTRYDPAKFKSFQEIKRTLGHEKRLITILKIDCETCEWSTYSDWIGLGIRQILIEVHNVPSPYHKNKIYFNESFNVATFFDAFVRNDYALFSKEVNAQYPNCVEYSFIKLHANFWKDSDGNHAGLLNESSYLLPQHIPVLV